MTAPAAPAPAAPPAAPAPAPVPAEPPAPAAPPAAPPAVAAPAVPTPPPATPPVPATPPAAPVKLDLKLPENSTLDPSVLETTTAIASELKLSPDDAKKMLGLVDQVASAHATKAVDGWQKAQVRGGAEFERRNAEYQAAALKDPDLGNGNPAQLQQRAKIAERALATLFPSVIEVITKAGLDSHPGLVKDLYRIGSRMKEDEFIVPAPGNQPPAKQRDADVLYGKKAS